MAKPEKDKYAWVGYLIIGLILTFLLFDPDYLFRSTSSISMVWMLLSLVYSAMFHKTKQKGFYNKMLLISLICFILLFTLSILF